jgi:superfamily II DNA or RNA helicase
MLPDDSLLVPRGMRRRIITSAEEMKIDFKVKDLRTRFDHIHIDSSLINYRPYQFPAVLNLTGMCDEGVLVAPAGSGKTVMGLSLIPLLGQPALWLTHTNPLAQQAEDRANFFLPNIGEIGRIGGGKWDIGEVLTIGMIQTLVRNEERAIKDMNRFGLVILDEAHHCPASTFLKVVGHFNPWYLYGLTATPYRRDKLEQLMFQALGETMSKISMEEVEKYGGIMVPTVRYRTVHSPTVDGNNIQHIITKHIVNNKKRNLMIVGDVLAEAAAGNYCIVIADRKAHCEILFELIQAGWDKTGIATGNYSKKYVQEQVERYNNNNITVLVATYSLLGEGFDVPFLNRAFITSPFRAEAKAEQLIGRIQRTHSDKKDAIVYDYVDVDIGVVKNQFYNKSGTCRYRTYEKLGVNVEPY